MPETQKPLTRNCRVRWTYEHWLNANSFSHRTKQGKYFGACRHTCKHWDKDGSTQMVYVYFDGNKRMSLVPLHEIEAL